MLQFYIKNFLLLPVLFTCCPLFSQTTNDQSKKLIEFSEQFYGVDDRLINGEINTINLNIKGHSFFLSDEWLSGELYIKGEKFKVANIKYNIESDNIYIIGQNKHGVIPNLALNKNFIDSLKINDHFFINSQILNNKDPYSLGFLELIYQKKFGIYIKYSISSQKDLSSHYVQFIYDKPQIQIYLYSNNNFETITNKKSFLELFKPYQKNIKQYMHKNHIRFKKANSPEIKSLFIYYDEISSN